MVKCTVRVVRIHRGKVIQVLFCGVDKLSWLLKWLKQEASWCAVELIMQAEAYSLHDIITRDWDLMCIFVYVCTGRKGRRNGGVNF